MKTINGIYTKSDLLYGLGVLQERIPGWLVWDNFSSLSVEAHCYFVVLCVL